MFFPRNRNLVPMDVSMTSKEMVSLQPRELALAFGQRVRLNTKDVNKAPRA